MPAENVFVCPEGQRLRYRGLNRQTQVYVYCSTPAQWRGMGIGITPSSSIAEREGHERVPGDGGHVLLAYHLVGDRAVDDLPAETRLPEALPVRASSAWK